MLAGLGATVPFFIKLNSLAIHKKIFAEQGLITLAAVGVFIFFVFACKLIFQRSFKAPDRVAVKADSELQPLAPASSNLIGISPRATVAALDSSSEVATTKKPHASSANEPSPTSIRSDATPAKANAPSPDSASALHTSNVYEILRSGTVIPAHPLALNSDRQFDERRMRGLTRYYLAAGAGGIAAAVHTTQFAIRQPKHNLLKPVLETVVSEIKQHESRTRLPIVKVAGICGDAQQAASEADLAAGLGYDAGLLNLSSLTGATDDQLIQHCRDVAAHIPLFGFYLAPALGGRPLSFNFWQRFCDIDNVVAIKIATFNRYQTIDVIRAVAQSGRALNINAKTNDRPIALYTGNDDTIVNDMLGTWTFEVNGKKITQRIVSGLLGHWACWTKSAADTLRSIKRMNHSNDMHEAIITVNRQVTDMNAAIFDAANDFKGTVPGVHEVLRKQGLLEGTWCLDSNQVLSSGQANEIERVSKAYPHLTDDQFVEQHLEEWLS